MIKLKRVLIILLNLILVLFIISTTVFGDLFSDFEKSIKTDGLGSQELETRAGKIVGLIQVVGTIVSVGMLIVLGIKYVLGSAEEKAEYKKTFMPYIIGAILIFGAANLTQIIYNWTKKSIL